MAVNASQSDLERAVLYVCLDCDHVFTTPGKTYSDLDLWCTNAIGACPQCLSDDYAEAFAPIPLVQMPVEVEPL